MRSRFGQLLPGKALESNGKSQSDTSIRPECLPEPIRCWVPSTEAKTRMRRTLMGLQELTEQEQKSLAELRAEISVGLRT